MRREPFGEIRLGAERPHHGGLVHTGDERVLQRPRGRNAPRTSGQTALADKISRLEECDDRFLALRRDDRNFDPAFSDVEDGIRRVTLGEDGLTLGVSGCPPSALARNTFGSNLDFDFLAMTEPPSARRRPPSHYRQTGNTTASLSVVACEAAIFKRQFFDLHGSGPLVPFDPTPKTSNVCSVADVSVANAADRDGFATSDRSASLRCGWRVA
jgi:hypothetical protein